MRKKDTFWQYATQDGDNFTCNFCKMKYRGGVSRLKSHLSLISGRDVASCTQVPENVQALAVVAIEKNNKTGKKRLYSEIGESHIPDSDSGLTQTTIPAIINKKDKDVVDMTVVTHFVMNNIAFNVVQTEAFKAMIDAVIAFGPGYKLPCYTTLRTKLVKNKREVVEEYITEIKDSWSVSGCTIMSDMWTDMKGRSYINVIASSPKGAVFLRSFERSSDKKTGYFLRDLLESVITEIGAENVVQVVFDNASNYGVAGDLIMERYPHIIKVRCAAHGVQLLLKDMYDHVGWMKNIFDRCKCIVDYMYKHGIITSLMREYTERELKKPAKTRFASQFLMLQSILDAEEGLRHTVASTTWRNFSYSKTRSAKDVVDIIQNEEFWKEGNELVLFLEPLVRILRLVDSDGSTNGYLFEAMERARMNLNEWHACSPEPEKYQKAIELFESRRKGNIVHVVHAAAAYFNPCLMYDKRVTCDQTEVREGLLFVGSKMLDLLEREQFAEQLLQYDGVWWEVNGGQIPVVKKVAIRILSQPSSASCCERNWSGFDAAQTKKRNKLTPEMLDDLVYIRMNSLMFSTSKDLEMQDRKAIDLEQLGPLPDYVDIEDPDIVEEEETLDLNNVEADTAWLDLRFGAGTSYL